jgi:hypothetical protein
MSDDDKKKIVSQPPPPTDEVDGEWGDDDQTLIRDVPEGVTQSQPAPAGNVVARTAVAPLSVPAKAAEASTPSEMKAAAPVSDSAAHEEDEEDEDEEDPSSSDEDEEDEDEEDEDDNDALPSPAAKNAAKKDWIPDWAPYAVLAVLVSVSMLVGLGLLSGSSPATTEEDAPVAKPAAKAPAKPSPHP